VSDIVLEGSCGVALVAFQFKVLALKFKGGTVMVKFFFLQRDDRL